MDARLLPVPVQVLVLLVSLRATSCARQASLLATSSLDSINFVDAMVVGLNKANVTSPRGATCVAGCGFWAPGNLTINHTNHVVELPRGAVGKKFLQQLRMKLEATEAAFALYSASVPPHRTFLEFAAGICDYWETIAAQHTSNLLVSACVEGTAWREAAIPGLPQPNPQALEGRTVAAITSTLGDTALADLILAPLARNDSCLDYERR